MEVQPVQCILYNTSIQYRGKQLRLFMAGDYQSYMDYLMYCTSVVTMMQQLCHNLATTIISKNVVPYTCMVA